MLCDHHHDWFPERFHHPTQKLCSHERIRPHFPLPRPSVISLLLPFSLFDHSRSLIEMGHTLFVLLCLACFTEHYIFKVHPCQSIPGCCKSGLCNWILAPCSCRTLKLKQWSCLTRPCPTELSVTSPTVVDHQRGGRHRTPALVWLKARFVALDHPTKCHFT